LFVSSKINLFFQFLKTTQSPDFDS